MRQKETHVKATPGIRRVLQALRQAAAVGQGLGTVELQRLHARLDLRTWEKEYGWIAWNAQASAWVATDLLPTHCFNGVDQLNGGVHPLRGVLCSGLREQGMSFAGYDAVVLVPRAVWVAGLLEDDPKFGQEFWDEFIADNELQVDRDGVAYIEQEANMADELEAL